MLKKIYLIIIFIVISSFFSCSLFLSEVTLNFDTNGGTGIIDPIITHLGESIILPSSDSISRPGFIFLGWYEIIEQDYLSDPVALNNKYVPRTHIWSVMDAGESFNVGDNVGYNATIYAIWTKRLSDYSFDSNIGSLINVNSWEYSHEIRSLDLSGFGYASLTASGIEHLCSLEYLKLDDNSISYINLLQELDFLTSLTATNNTIEDVSPLRDLINLKTLYLSYNTIIDVTPLNTLVNLEWLTLDNNSIVTGVETLSSLSNVTAINLLNNPGIPTSDLDALEAALGDDHVNRVGD